MRKQKGKGGKKRATHELSPLIRIKRLDDGPEGPFGRFAQTVDDGVVAEIGEVDLSVARDEKKEIVEKSVGAGPKGS